MTPALATALGYACYAGGAVAILAYIVQGLRYQRWRRPWNAAGLFFTSLSLAFLPQMIVSGAASRPAVIVVVGLLLAVGLQAFTALRTRKRAEPPPTSKPT